LPTALELRSEMPFYLCCSGPQGVDGGGNDTLVLERMRKIAGIKNVKPLPLSIDIFASLRQQEPYEWPATFATFIVQLDNDSKILNKLLNASDQWKLQLFYFLSQVFAWDLRSEGDRGSERKTNMNPSSKTYQGGEKARLLNFAISILATIDVRSFLPAEVFVKPAQSSNPLTPRDSKSRPKSNRKKTEHIVEPKGPDFRRWWFLGNKVGVLTLAIEQTLIFISKTADFLSEKDNHATGTHLLGLISSKLLTEFRKEESRFKNDWEETEEQIDSPRWGRIVTLVTIIRNHVLQTDKLKGFKLLVSDHKFVDEELVDSTAEFLETKLVLNLLSSQRHIEMLQDAKNQRQRSLIAQRHSALTQHRDLFSSLSAVMRRAVDGAIKAMGKSLATHKRSGSRSRSRTSIKTNRSSKDKDFNRLLEKVEEAYGNQERLVTTLVLFGYGNANQIRASLKIAMNSIKATGDRKSQAAGMSNLVLPSQSSMVIKLLSEAQTEDVKKQLPKRPIRNSSGGYRSKHSVTLSKVPVIAEEFPGERIQGKAKSLILLHQQVGSNQFIQALFGVCQSQLGWLILKEKIPLTLNNILEGTLSVISGLNSEASGRSGRGIRRREHISERMKMKIAVGIASGLERLHGEDSFHGDLKPKYVGLDFSFGVKLMDFGSPSSELQDVKTNDSAYLAPECFTIINSASSSMPKSEALRKMDVYACGTIITELFSSERRRLRAWLPPDLPGAFKKLTFSARNAPKGHPIPTFTVHKVLEPRRPELAGFLAHCISIRAEGRPEMKKVRLALCNLERDADQMHGDVIYLDQRQSSSIAEQLAPINKIKNEIDSYKVYLSSLHVHAKILNCHKMQGEHLQFVKSKMRLCLHPNIIDVLGCAWSDRYGWVLVTEHCDTHFGEVLANPSSFPSMKRRLQMASELIDAISEFHADRRPCRLAAESIFVTRDFGVKLSPHEGNVLDLGGNTRQDAKVIVPPEIKGPVANDPSVDNGGNVSPRYPLSPRESQRGDFSPIQPSQHLAEKDNDNSGIRNAYSRLQKNTPPELLHWTQSSDIYVLGNLLLDWLPEFRIVSRKNTGGGTENAGKVNRRNTGARSRAQSMGTPVESPASRGRFASARDVYRLPGQALTASKRDAKLKQRRVSEVSSKQTFRSDPNLGRLSLERNLNHERGGSSIINLLQQKHSSLAQSATLHSARKLLAVPGSEKSAHVISADLGETLERCLERNPFKRPTIEDVREALSSELQDEEPADTKSVVERSQYEKSSRRPQSPRSRSRNPPSRLSIASAGTPASNIDRKLNKRKIQIRGRGLSSVALDPPEEKILSRAESRLSDGGRVLKRGISREPSERTDILASNFMPRVVISQGDSLSAGNGLNDTSGSPRVFITPAAPPPAIPASGFGRSLSSEFVLENSVSAGQKAGLTKSTRNSPFNSPARPTRKDSKPGSFSGITDQVKSARSRKMWSNADSGNHLRHLAESSQAHTQRHKRQNSNQSAEGRIPRTGSSQTQSQRSSSVSADAQKMAKDTISEPRPRMSQRASISISETSKVEGKSNPGKQLENKIEPLPTTWVKHKAAGSCSFKQERPTSSHSTTSLATARTQNPPRLAILPFGPQSQLDEGKLQQSKSNVDRNDGDDYDQPRPQSAVGFLEVVKSTSAIAATSGGSTTPNSTLGPEKRNDLEF